MVQDHLDNDPDSALVRRLKKCLEVIQRAVCGIHGTIVGNVVAVIAQGRREKRHQPDGIDAKIL